MVIVNVPTENQRLMGQNENDQLLVKSISKIIL